MKELSYDQLSYDELYAELCEIVHTKKTKEEPTFLKILMNLAYNFLLLVAIAMFVVAIFIDRIWTIARKRYVPPENHIAIELIPQNNN